MKGTAISQLGHLWLSLLAYGGVRLWATVRSGQVFVRIPGMAKTVLTGDAASRASVEGSAPIVPLRVERALDVGAVTYGAASPELEFPGCEPMCLTRDGIDAFEGRLEFWDADAELAWVVCEPTSPVHESPAHGLAALVERIAAVRGSPIKCYGAMDLMQRDAAGAPRRIMQADQSLYLRPKRVVLPGVRAMIVGEHALPDVVLEVDHTTDVRRGKLLQYEAWRFPEVWVEVPVPSALSRPPDLAPGLTIYALEDGSYGMSAESRAFPGWTATEIHAAMNETTPSARTYEVLERVGMLLGAGEGTGPCDDPLLRSQRRQGFEAGRTEQRMAIVLELMRSRGIAISQADLDKFPALSELSEAAVVSAALDSASAADFGRRVHQQFLLERRRK